MNISSENVSSSTPTPSADNPPIDLIDVANNVDGKNYVIFTVPTIYVAVDETNDDECVVNLRAIECERLMEMAKLIPQIEANDYDSQLRLTERFICDIMEKESDNPELFNCLKIISFICQSARDIDIDDFFVNSVSTGISLDPIRRYENDPRTSVLERAEPCQWNGASLFSQLDAREQERARKALNATDLNLVRYMLTILEQTLLFRRNRIANRTVDMVNIALFYITLLEISRPVRDRCANDTKDHFVGFMIDLVIRTRLISAWQRNDFTHALLRDITRNYSSDNVLVNICWLNHPRERAQKILQLLRDHMKKSSKLAATISQLSFAKYTDVLENTKQLINDKEYYVITSSFVGNIALTEGIATMENLKDGLFDSKNDLE